MKAKPLLIMAGAFLLMGMVSLGALFLYEPVTSKEPLPVIGQAPSFSLTNSEGKTFDQSLMQGKVWVADFFFSSCAGPCPTMAANMGSLARRFRKHPNVQFVSFSVDPETDNPEVLRKYAAKLNADTSRWHFLTGPNEAIGKLVDVEGFKLGSSESILAHSTRFVLVDSQGQIRGYYEGIEEAGVHTLARDIVRLQKEKK